MYFIVARLMFLLHVTVCVSYAELRLSYYIPVRLYGILFICTFDVFTSW